ncbi:nucleotide pyrophosphatase/phosphodiesterase family protein [Hyphomicrobium sp.]|uniref:nucleotide pyrophosphatase/phosphodiesterase family protein n=1 Tax=Hyphomicrobium sp. TaxID=82 RepID=UPI002E32417D|nr:nucleotide pyrophosphatase/phosphodiesterase family protein [Hyphomicrobium sp.]HEX2841083.1 nucleotide pyrophosphatase/phosphodiesterase family protein [Hyphomicrobium sp.]
MTPTVVINVVGLAPALIGPHTPNLARFAAAGCQRPLKTVTPAVTCSVQATFVTGLPPSGHGIVGNGWLFRDLMDVWLWRQSNKLVAGERVWDAGKSRDPAFTCANLFWWYAMAASTDIAVTPRPIYKADGRKLPDCYSDPPEIRDDLTRVLGAFPLFHFWGPATSIKSSRWIADAAKHVLATRNPTLTLVYLPHLDYVLQRLGPDDPAIAKDLAEIDAVAGDLIDHAQKMGRRVIVLSEYGIAPARVPIHINRALRAEGLLAIREEDGGEILDVHRSRAFAVSDHQIVHIYVRDPADLALARSCVERLDGVAHVLDREEQAPWGLNHDRAGDLVALSDHDAWFTYYYWLDDARAPDFARTVDIHKKPGYDPVELFIDPAIRLPKLAIARRLAKKALGFRTLMDVIPLNASLVKGSHGRADLPEAHGPVFLSSEPHLIRDEPVDACEVKSLMLSHVFDP